MTQTKLYSSFEKVSNIILIEPSQLAISRGLLHVDVLKENPMKIRAINKD